MAEPDPFEELNESELTELQKPDSPLAVRARNFMSLASEVANRTLDPQDGTSKYDDAWGGTWCGGYGWLGEFKVWIGFTTASWSRYGRSPIWIEIEELTGFPKAKARLSSLKLDEDYFVHPDGRKIELPVLLRCGSRDEVLESCVESVLKIKKLLNPAA